jgi:hypothetical protein
MLITQIEHLSRPCFATSHIVAGYADHPDETHMRFYSLTHSATMPCNGMVKFSEQLHCQSACSCSAFHGTDHHTIAPAEVQDSLSGSARLLEGKCKVA